MKKIFAIILSIIFSISILVASILGETIRDSLSPKVEVMSPVYYVFDDGQAIMSGLSSECFFYTENGSYAFVVEEKNDTGEKAYFAKKVAVVTGKSDNICTELVKSSHFNGMYICYTSTPIHDGERVVITKISNSP